MESFILIHYVPGIVTYHKPLPRSLIITEVTYTNYINYILVYIQHIAGEIAGCILVFKQLQRSAIQRDRSNMRDSEERRTEQPHRVARRDAARSAMAQE